MKALEQEADLQKAIAGGKEVDPRPRQFLPPSAHDLRANRATAEMNQPDVQAKWADVMTLLLNRFMRGAVFVDVLVPRGGTRLLRSLGYYCFNVQDVDGMERASVALDEPSEVLARGAAS